MTRIQRHRTCPILSSPRVGSRIALAQNAPVETPRPAQTLVVLSGVRPVVRVGRQGSASGVLWGSVQEEEELAELAA